MNRLYETGLMLIVFTIAINSAIVSFGEPMMAAKLPGLDSNHSFSSSDQNIFILDQNFTQNDVNDIVSSGSNIIKSQDPLSEQPTVIGKGLAGVTAVLGMMAWFASAYYVVLDFILPPELGFIAIMVFTIVTAIQVFTITHFIMVFVSIIRGGGF